MAKKEPEAKKKERQPKEPKRVVIRDGWRELSPETRVFLQTCAQAQSDGSSTK